MGVIKKQAIRGSFWSYVGIVLGFVNLAFFHKNSSALNRLVLLRF
jgi:hypothetical protein